MTSIDILPTRRNEIKQAVIKALKNSDSRCLPLKIKSIVRSFSNVRLISFSKHMKRMNLTYKQMITSVGSNDACTDFYVDSGLYYIYYNDIDKNITNSNRYRWNIAHELGHILLKHHVDNNKTRIFRSALTDSEYDLLEAEADYFAQLILVPHAALIGFRINSHKNIRNMCKISDPAAKKRFYEYNIWKNHVDSEDNYDKQIFAYFYSFLFKKKCLNCGSGIVQRYGEYCIICGKKSLQWGDGDMIYEKIKTYKNNKLCTCPVCDNEETDVDGNFCSICSFNLINSCSNFECTETLPSNARYCPKCGCKSMFLKNDVLKPWNYHEPTGFMGIPDFDMPDGVENEGLPFN